MPDGPCPATWEFEVQTPVHDGSVRCWGTVDYDGVSQRGVGEGCDGELTSLGAQNTASQVAYVHLPNKRRGDKWVEVQPGQTVNISAGQRTQLGLEFYHDIWGVTVGPEPEFGPAALKMK